MKWVERSEWLAGLAAGDDVLIRELGGWYQSWQEAKVERTTAKYVIVRGKRYRRRDGEVVGSYSRTCIQEPDAERLAEVEECRREERHRNAVGTLLHLKRDQISKLPIEVLEQAIAILSPEPTP